MDPLPDYNIAMMEVTPRGRYDPSSHSYGPAPAEHYNVPLHEYSTRSSVDLALPAGSP